MREAAHKAGIKLLEPIMKVEVVTPEDYLGDVIGDLNSRRGQIHGTDSRGNAQVIEATCRSRTCSATSISCARSRREGRSTRCLCQLRLDLVGDVLRPPLHSARIASCNCALPA